MEKPWWKKSEKKPQQKHGGIGQQGLTYQTIQRATVEAHFSVLQLLNSENKSCGCRKTIWRADNYLRLGKLSVRKIGKVIPVCSFRVLWVMMVQGACCVFHELFVLFGPAVVQLLTGSQRIALSPVPQLSDGLGIAIVYFRSRSLRRRLTSINVALCFCRSAEKSGKREIFELSIFSAAGFILALYRIASLSL